MKLDIGVLNDHEITTLGKTSKMRLSSKASSMIFKMFTKSVYSDPIGTIIREITSNCFDSHIEAGNESSKNPVIVRLHKDLTSNYISFIDNGVGMSPDRIHNVYGEYFESTKRTSNDQIGGWGIGGKSILAYTSSFHVITRHDGIEYTYCVYEGNEEPEIELLAQRETTERNGTEVKVPIAEQNIKEFEEKTLRQLYYFENIVFEGFSDDYVTNDYTIIKGKTFLYRGNTYSQFMHVCLGKVAYPIDWSALGLNAYSYHIPVAVRIDIGELEGSGVTVSRESLDYSEKNKKILIKKINEAKAELKSMLSKQYENVRTLKDYFISNENRYTLFFPDGRSIDLNSIDIDVKFQNFKYNKFFLPTQHEILSHFFTVKKYGLRKKNNELSLNSLESKNNIYYTKPNAKRNNLKQQFLRTLHSSFYVLEPIVLDDYTNTFSTAGHRLTNREKLKSILTREKDVFGDLIESDIPENEIFKLIDELTDDIVSYVKEKSISYDDLEVPQVFIESRKKAKSNKRFFGDGIAFPVKNCVSDYYYTVELKDLQEYTGRIYYGTKEDYTSLKNAYRVFNSLTEQKVDYSIKYKPQDGVIRILFISVAKQNLKFIQSLGRKAIHVDNFYQTYVRRKLDMLIDNKIKYHYYNQWHEDVFDIFYNERVMPHINNDIFETAHKINKSLINNEKNLLNYISESQIKHYFKIDLDDPSLLDRYEYKDEFQQIVELSQKSMKRFQWINFPYRIDLNNEDHQELINILKILLTN